MLDETLYFCLHNGTLTDGSQVHNLAISHNIDDDANYGRLYLHATSHDDAVLLQEKIWNAIREHTNEILESTCT